MKKTLLVILVLMFAISANAQSLILEENFSYTSATTLTANGWTAHSGSGSTPLTVTESNLSYSGYFSSTGNAVTVTSGSGTREDAHKTFTAVTSGNVYVSFLVNVSAATTTEDYFFHLGPNTISTIFRGRIFVERDASNNLAFGLSKGSGTTTNLTGYSYALNTTYLIVIKYEIVDGTLNDALSLWINPDLSGSEPTADLTHSDGAISDPVDIGSIAIRQGSQAITAVVDGIRVSDSWSLAPLPVELTSFTAITKGRGVELAWKTATELNNVGFEVEKNVGGTWNKIGFVEGAGTSNAPKNYTFVDANAKGNVSYRLKQIDRDGKFEYSQSVEANIALTAEDFSLTQNYPNPFNPTTSFSFAVKNSEHVNVTVYNSLGQVVATLFNNIANPNELYSLNFDGKNLSSGTYFYALRSATRNEVRKMQLTK